MNKKINQIISILVKQPCFRNRNEGVSNGSLLETQDEFHSCLIARDFSYDLGANRSNIYKIEHIDSLEKQITNIGLLVAGYNTLREPVKNQVQYIKNIFKDIDILSSGIEKILDLIVEESSKLLKNKEEFRKHQHSRIEKAS